MRKKLALALALVLAMGTFALAGCSSTGSKNGSGAADSQQGEPKLTVAMELAYPPF